MCRQTFRMTILLLAAFFAGSAALPVSTVRGKRSDDGGPLEVVVEQLSQQVASLAAQLTQLTGTVNSKLTALEARAARLEKTVAFYAWTNHQPIHVSAGSTLIFEHLISNVGNAYDPQTGFFIAPVSGLYDFQVTVMGAAPETHPVVHGFLYLEDAAVAATIADSAHGRYSQSSSRAVLHVNAGQRLSVRNVDNTDSNYYGDLYTTFSGFLILAD